ncbi:MAG: ribokinase [Chloroflexi bacterium]|nr:ribokinase [Chloroflexota bacterium]
MIHPCLAPNIVALGGMNMALIGTAARLPNPGETLRGERFYTAPGGKGATQAVAAARLGANVKMVGRVGKDVFGPTLLNALKKDGIDVTGVAEDPDHPSGVGMIVLNAERQNHVLAIYGANLQCNEDQLLAVEAALNGAHILLLQMELPFALSVAAARSAKARGVITMLDPAPASDIPHEAFPYLDIITPNQPEAEYHTGIMVNDVPSAKAAADVLLHKGVKTAVVKMAEQGVYWASREASGYVPAYEVEVVDTISAGDAFSGALAVALGEGRSMEHAIRYGAAAGALAVTKRGVQTAMPFRGEVDELFNRYV